MNSVLIVGRSGRDADEMKRFDSGKTRTTFSLAVNRWDSKTSAEITDWFNIEAWDRMAEFASKYVKKGGLFAVEGRMRVSNWKDQNGEDRQSYIVTANNIRFVGGKKEQVNDNI